MQLGWADCSGGAQSGGGTEGVPYEGDGHWGRRRGSHRKAPQVEDERSMVEAGLDRIPKGCEEVHVAGPGLGH